MADLDFSKSSILTTPKGSSSSSWFSTLSRYLFNRTIFFFILVALLPLFPSQPPEPPNRSFFSRGLELLRLLLVGVAISYGLFCRRNNDSDAGEKDLYAVPPPKSDVSPHSYVAGILNASSVFDDDNYADAAEAATASLEPCLDEQTKTTQAWSSQYYPAEPAVMVANDFSGKPLSLPVRRLGASIDEENKDSVVLPSPIPWRSRSERMMELNEQNFSGSTISSKAPSPEVRAKSGEDIIMIKKTMQKSATLPPPPPPPPPTSYIHGYSAYTARRDYKNRSFKEELKDHSRSRVREEFMQPRSARIVRSNGMNGSIERAAKVESKTSMEKMAEESRQPPPPPLMRSKSEKARNETRRKNEFREKMIVCSDDSQSDVDPDEEETTEVIDGSPPRISAKEASPPPPPPSPPPPPPVADENEVDKKADEFIAKFREQIRLQRIESIKKSTGQRNPISPN